MDQQLLALPAGQLLEKFGAGGHKPGSGSAAALMGILAGKLVITVGKLSLGKPKYRPNHRAIAHTIEQIEKEIEPRLRELFERDAEVFDAVIKLRVARDQAAEEKEKRRLREQALEKQKDATDIPFEIADLCIRLLDHGVRMFDLGFESARGDSGAAVSAAVAGAMSCVFVINLNLKPFRDSEWAIDRRRKVDELHRLLEAKQLDAFSRVVMLKEEDVAAVQLPLAELLEEERRS